MARRFSYIVVEGPHDESFLGRILRRGGQSFHLIERKSEVDPHWHSLIPKNYPVGLPPNDFLQRVPMPTFYQNETHSVAIQSANGIDKIVRRLEETLQTPELNTPDSIGVVLDSDSTETTVARSRDLASKIQALSVKFAPSWPELPGALVSALETRCRLGQFVLPDNQAQGTLEDILIAVGRIAYPSLFPMAEAHVQAAQTNLVVGQNGWTGDDNREFRAPAGPKKATVASATAILKPGKTCQVTLADNRWIDASTLQVSPLKEFAEWLHALVL